MFNHCGIVAGVVNVGGARYVYGEFAVEVEFKLKLFHLIFVLLVILAAPGGCEPRIVEAEFSPP